MKAPFQDKEVRPTQEAVGHGKDGILRDGSCEESYSIVEKILINLGPGFWDELPSLLFSMAPSSTFWEVGGSKIFTVKSF